MSYTSVYLQEKFSVDHFVFGINLHYPHVYPIAQDSQMKEQLTNDLLIFKKVFVSFYIHFIVSCTLSATMNIIRL